MLLFMLISTTSALFLIAYHHVGYPILLKLIILNKKYNTKSKAYKNPCTDQQDYTIANSDFDDNNQINSENLPSICIVLAAYNEEKYIAEKLRNLASLDYPRDKLRIRLACDGCTDNTVAIATTTISETEFSDLKITIHDYPENRGKSATLNAVMANVKEDITAFSDISSLISIDALRIAATRFNDDNIGAVNGNYRFLHPQNSAEENYWRYQKNIKLGEESLGSILGAHGAFYLLRTSLFQTLEYGTINDDFIIPMRAIAQGKRVVYDQRINAIELEDSDTDANWSRRKRIGFGNAQQVVILKNLFHPKYLGIAFAFFSGKGLRVLMPFIMLYALFGSIYCTYFMPMLLPVLLIQCSIYGAAIYAHCVKQQSVGRIARLCHYLVSGHLANFYGGLAYAATYINRSHNSSSKLSKKISW